MIKLEAAARLEATAPKYRNAAAAYFTVDKLLEPFGKMHPIGAGYEYLTRGITGSIATADVPKLKRALAKAKFSAAVPTVTRIKGIRTDGKWWADLNQINPPSKGDYMPCVFIQKATGDRTEILIVCRPTDIYVKG